MIRRTQTRYDDDLPIYSGPERRQQPYIESVPEPTKTSPFPFWLQLVGFIVTLIGSSVGTYISLHDEQLRLAFNLSQLQTEAKEANEVHNKTHDKIFQQIDRVSIQVHSMEDTMTSIMQQRKR
jgi:hypothetical protein